MSRLLVLDFGSQYTHLICRRLREIGIYSELRKFDIAPSELAEYNPAGLILSGGPSSVYDAESPHLSLEIWRLIEEKKFPVLGICYGMQEICFHFDVAVARAEKREFGFAEVEISRDEESLENGVDLFDGIDSPFQVWMSHSDEVDPAGLGPLVPLALVKSGDVTAIKVPGCSIYGVQFHPEVSHTLMGTRILQNFCRICTCEFSWNMHAFVENELSKLKEIIHADIHVVGAVSGGVDSTVAAALLHRAIGEKFHPVFIDTGLLRKDEVAEVRSRMNMEIPGLNLTVIDASEDFFRALKGVTEPETKRKIIGNLFIEIFERTVTDILGLDVETCLLLQGTLYPDVIESASHNGPSHTIKTHHNVGGLPEKMKLKVLEPFRMLFKDEVKKLGNELGLSRRSIGRHPFPGPGLAIRIIGEVTLENVEILRKADAIFIQELVEAGEYDKIAQAFAVLVPGVRTVGVMGDGRTYESLCCLRAVESSDFMTADWYKISLELLSRISTRITNEVAGINRVCYDISSKPPATIEWE